MAKPAYLSRSLLLLLAPLSPDTTQPRHSSANASRASMQPMEEVISRLSVTYYSLLENSMQLITQAESIRERSRRDYLAPVCGSSIGLWISFGLMIIPFLSGPCGLLGYDRPSYFHPVTGEIVSAVHFEMDGVLHSVNLTRTSDAPEIQSQVLAACKDNFRCIEMVTDLLEERLEKAVAAEGHRWRMCRYPSALLYNLLWFSSRNGRYRWFLRVADRGILGLNWNATHLYGANRPVTCNETLKVAVRTFMERSITTKDGIFVSSGAAGSDIQGMCDRLAGALEDKESRHDQIVLVMTIIAGILALGSALDITMHLLALANLIRGPEDQGLESPIYQALVRLISTMSPNSLDFPCDPRELLEWENEWKEMNELMDKGLEIATAQKEKEGEEGKGKDIGKEGNVAEEQEQLQGAEQKHEREHDEEGEKKADEKKREEGEKQNAEIENSEQARKERVGTVEERKVDVKLATKVKEEAATIIKTDKKKKSQKARKAKFGRKTLAWSGLYPLQFIKDRSDNHATLLGCSFSPLKLVAAFVIMLAHSFRFNGQDLITWIFPLLDPQQHNLGNMGLSVLLILSGFTCALSAKAGDTAFYGMQLHPLNHTANALSRRLIRILIPYFTMIWAVAFGLFFVSSCKSTYFGYSSKTWIFIAEMTLVHPWTAYFVNPLSMPLQSLPGVWNDMNILVTMWTLPFQLHCYFLFAFCEMCIRRADSAYIYPMIWFGLARAQYTGFIEHESKISWFSGTAFGQFGIYADFFFGVTLCHWCSPLVDVFPFLSNDACSSASRLRGIVTYIIFTVVALAPSVLGYNSIAALFYTPWLGGTFCFIGLNSKRLRDFERKWATRRFLTGIFLYSGVFQHLCARTLGITHPIINFVVSLVVTLPVALASDIWSRLWHRFIRTIEKAKPSFQALQAEKQHSKPKNKGESKNEKGRGGGGKPKIRRRKKRSKTMFADSTTLR